MNRHLKNALVALSCVLFSYVIWVFSPSEGDGGYGGWSLLPPGLTLLVCFLTRNVILALFIGVFSGGLVTGQLNIVQAYLIPSLGTENYAQILLVYLWALGGLLGLWNRNGGARYFAQYVWLHPLVPCAEFHDVGLAPPFTCSAQRALSHSG